MSRAVLTSLTLAFALLVACSDDGQSDTSSDSDSETQGDGDGDSGDGDGDSGDGDGDSGDGDGDSGDGDGDSGDGDGDSGDGDGDSGDGDGDGDGDSGDGDGDGDEPSCEMPGELGNLDYEQLDQGISEFYGDGDFAAIISSQEQYAALFEGPAPADFANEWLVFVHPGRTSIGTNHGFAGMDVSGACSLSVAYAISTLGDNCETFTTYSRPGPLLARTPIAFAPPSEPELIPAPGQPFDCEQGQGEFESCSESNWCATGLICAGITRFETGMCMDANLRGVFESGQLDLPFTDAEPFVTTLEGEGLATVDMDVIINVELEHADPSTLTITLTNPSGNEVPVWTQEPSPYDAPWYPEPGVLRLSRVPVGFSGDEDVNGTWTLEITSESEVAGTLRGWTLEIMSRFD